MEFNENEDSFDTEDLRNFFKEYVEALREEYLEFLHDKNHDPVIKESYDGLALLTRETARQREWDKRYGIDLEERESILMRHSGRMDRIIEINKKLDELDNSCQKKVKPE
jgi:hypothetical protein